MGNANSSSGGTDFSSFGSQGSPRGPSRSRSTMSESSSEGISESIRAMQPQRQPSVTISRPAPSVTISRPAPSVIISPAPSEYTNEASRQSFQEKRQYFEGSQTPLPQEEPKIGRYTERELLAMKPSELQKACRREREVRDLVCIQSTDMNYFWKRKTEHDFGRAHNLAGFNDNDDWLMIHFLKSVGAQFNSVNELINRRVLDLSDTDATKIRNFPRRGLKIIRYENGREVSLTWPNLEVIDLSDNSLAALPEMEYRTLMPRLKLIKIINVPLHSTITRYLKKYPNIIFQAGEGDFRNADESQLLAMGLKAPVQATFTQTTVTPLASEKSFVRATMTPSEQRYFEGKRETSSSSGILESLDLATASQRSQAPYQPSSQGGPPSQYGRGLMPGEDSSSGIMDSLAGMSGSAIQPPAVQMEEESSGISGALSEFGLKKRPIRDIEFYFV